MRKLNIKQMYDKYLGEKCTLGMFYKRIHKGIPPEIAIKPTPKKIGNVRSKLFADELEWYYQQPEPKPSKEKFYGRLFKGYPKEEAIREKLILKQRKKKKPIRRSSMYIVPHTKPIEPKQDSYEIRITYSKEEAEVIKREYEGMINILENTIYEDEETKKANNIKLDGLKKEYNIFKSYNQ